MAVNGLGRLLEKAAEEIDEYVQLFNLQHGRIQEAQAIWQKATDKHDVWPDLGTLIGWLIGRLKSLESCLAKKHNVPSLDATIPLVLYFASRDEVEEFVAELLKANPGMIERDLQDD